MKTKVFNVIILDQSGSMGCIHHEAVSGVNETIQSIQDAQKKEPDQEHTVTLVTFNSSETRAVIQNQPVDKIKLLKEKEFQPRASTPLFDAMGNTINRIHKWVKDVNNAAVAVTVITDGYENASREFSGNDIKALIDARKEEGWLFSYIGANQDVKAVGRQMSIDNTLSFECSCIGTEAMFRKERNARRGWLDKLSKLNDTNLTEAERMEIKRESSANYFD